MIDSHAVYDGQTFTGSISNRGGGFVAIDANGKRLGVFPTRTEAVRAVLSPPAPPASPVKTPAQCDTDAAILRAIEDLAKGGAS